MSSAAIKWQWNNFSANFPAANLNIHGVIYASFVGSRIRQCDRAPKRRGLSSARNAADRHSVFYQRVIASRNPRLDKFQTYELSLHSFLLLPYQDVTSNKRRLG